MSIKSHRKHAPSIERNKDPILAVLKTYLPDHGTVLEIASGSGQHAIHFIKHLPNHYWQPSDPDRESRNSIRDWWWKVQLNNILPPMNIRTDDDIWAVEQEQLPLPVSAIVCINMIHIAPWEASIGLMKGAERILPAGGILYLYGPYKIDGKHTAPSNELFDVSLHSRNPKWGVRDLADVKKLAQNHSLEFVETVKMPANNLSVIFKKL